MVVCLEQGADCLHMIQLMTIHHKTPSLVLLKSILVLPFWYQLTQAVLEKRPLNGCSVEVYCKKLDGLQWIWGLTESRLGESVDPL